MRLKPGAKFPVLTTQLLLGLTIARELWFRYGHELEVTSGSEPETVHTGKPVKGDTLDPHYMGKAADLSTKRLAPGGASLIVQTLRESLGPEYVVLLEDRDTPNEHIHLQWGHI